MNRPINKNYGEFLGFGDSPVASAKPILLIKTRTPRSSRSCGQGYRPSRPLHSSSGEQTHCWDTHHWLWNPFNINMNYDGNSKNRRAWGEETQDAVKKGLMGAEEEAQRLRAVLLLQRPRLQFPAPTTGDSQPPVTPALWDLRPFSSFQGHGTHVYISNWKYNETFFKRNNWEDYVEDCNN